MLWSGVSIFSYGKCEDFQWLLMLYLCPHRHACAWITPACAPGQRQDGPAKPLYRQPGARSLACRKLHRVLLPWLVHFSFIFFGSAVVLLRPARMSEQLVCSARNDIEVVFFLFFFLKGRKALFFVEAFRCCHVALAPIQMLV